MNGFMRRILHGRQAQEPRPPRVQPERQREKFELREQQRRLSAALAELEAEARQFEN